MKIVVFVALALSAAILFAADNTVTQVIDVTTPPATNASTVGVTKVSTKPAQVVTNITTLDGKTYTNAVVTRVDPDGLSLRLKSGIRKVYFAELSAEIQKQFGYDAEKERQYREAATIAARERSKREALQGSEAAEAEKERAIAEEKKRIVQKERAETEARIIKLARTAVNSDYYWGQLRALRQKWYNQDHAQDYSDAKDRAKAMTEAYKAELRADQARNSADIRERTMKRIEEHRRIKANSTSDETRKAAQREIDALMDTL